MAASLTKLALAPDQEGYALDFGATTVASKLEGGASRMRRDILNTPAMVSVQWTCNKEEMEYLQTFYRVNEYGSNPFYMDLLISQPTLTTHVCRFVPNTFKVTGVRGKELFKITAKIEAELLAFDDDYDEGVVTSFEAFGQEATSAYALLQTLVNVNMPAKMK